MSSLSNTVKFNEIDKGDLASVGGKGANLGEMTKAGFPVPNGFAVTIHAYDNFLTSNNLHKKIYELLGDTDVNQSTQLEATSKNIQKMVINGKLPDEVSREIISAYKKLSGSFKKTLVAVRSSAT